MNTLTRLVLFVLINRLNTEFSHLNEGASCTNPDTLPGICTNFTLCPEARHQVKTFSYHNFTRCSFLGHEEIVCCPRNLSTRDMDNHKICSPSKDFCDKYTASFKPSLSPQISDGENAQPGRFPFMGALGRYIVEEQIYKFDCGGVLISERHVVTAAHCMENLVGDVVEVVRLGAVKVPATASAINPETDYKVKNFIMHPQFRWRFNSTYRNYNDIAVIELERAVEFKKELGPACLFRNDTWHPEEYIILGWGDNESINRKETLQMAKVSHYSYQKCYDRYRKVFNITLEDSHLCVQHETEETCQGDFLIMPNSTMIVGITSFGTPGCGIPSVYTSIAKHLDWIENVVWGEHKTFLKTKDFCANFTASFKPSLSPQIADGNDAAPGRFPFMGALGL